MSPAGRMSEPSARPSPLRSSFGRSVLIAVAAGAVVRLLYILTDTRTVIGGDGFCYYIQGLLLADGNGFTSCFPEQFGHPVAHHPPLWFILLAGLALLGIRDVVAYQLFTSAVGLGVVALCGVVGRRYFGERAGVVAAWLAALYPGFWVIEAQMLAEPLCLLLLGVLALVVRDLRTRPTLARVLVAGAVCGLLTMVRSEQLAMLGVVAVALLVPVRGPAYGRRILLAAASVVPCALVIAPWVIFNSTRFAEPVYLSHNGGSTLLVGNCPPSTYEGELMGYYDGTCDFKLVKRNPGLDRSQLDRLAIEAARRHMDKHRDLLPRVVAARFGRMFAVFEPEQTVHLTAKWMRSAEWTVWAWVVSYWLLFPMAVVGAAIALRERRQVSPFLLPIGLSIAIVAITYGEPRYHTPSDLGVVVLAGFWIERVFSRRTA
jgi:4-amino-4-deoxy-L-arabinose transferase-like glycosyltransferase